MLCIYNLKHVESLIENLIKSLIESLILSHEKRVLLS